MYSVKEIFYTLQGEGARVGRPAVFCRFSGCNLWSGREKDRETAICRFCDTDFVGTNGSCGGKFESTHTLAISIAKRWIEYDPSNRDKRRYVVLTGGEPLLQVDDGLVWSLHRLGFEVAVETNGTLPCSPKIDWICVSPKANAPLVQDHGNELKLVYPQDGIDPKQYEHLMFDRFFLQPKHDLLYQKRIMDAVAYCMKNPRWDLSLQTHKMIGIR